MLTWSQAEPEHIATELVENLNLKDEEKLAETTLEEEGKAAAPAHPDAEPTTAVEEPHSSAAVLEEEELKEDAGDSRQHLNVVFIGHVGTVFVAASPLQFSSYLGID